MKPGWKQALALAMCGWVWVCQADTLRGRVVGVADGDTVTVLDAQKVQHKVRLSGIDAPERSQAFGQRSKEHLSDLVFGQTVEVDFNKTDRYGRLIGKIVVNGQDANLQQLHAGMAWHYKEYEREQPPEERRRYAQAEDDARDRGVGLWKDLKPVPPWEFRRAQRQR